MRVTGGLLFNGRALGRAIYENFTASLVGYAFLTYGFEQ